LLHPSFAATGAALARLGNFCNSEIVGRKTDGSWGVRFARYDRPSPDAGPDWQATLRHPTQLYEATLALFTLVVLLLADRAFGKEKRPRALLISLFFAVYFTGRLGIEFTKEYRVPALEGTFTMGQYLSMLPAILGWYGVAWALKHKISVGWEPVDLATAEEEEEDDQVRRPRLYDPDVEDVFGRSRRHSRSERRRKRRRRAFEAPTHAEDTLPTNEEDDDQPMKAASTTVSDPAQSEPKRSKRREDR
jgi:hypothetical protein